MEYKNIMSINTPDPGFGFFLATRSVANELGLKKSDMRSDVRVLRKIEITYLKHIQISRIKLPQLLSKCHFLTIDF